MLTKSLVKPDVLFWKLVKCTSKELFQSTFQIYVNILSMARYSCEDSHQEQCGESLKKSILSGGPTKKEVFIVEEGYSIYFGPVLFVLTGII